MTLHLHTLESIFKMSCGAKKRMAIYFLTLKSIFVMLKGAKNDNVYTNFGLNLCNA